jgi:NitT/TauT family transport system substrate-binding protein
MKKAKTILLLFISACVFCILLTGCAGNNRDGSEVRIAYFPNITHAQALFMKSEGTFEAKLPEGVTVRWMAFNAGPAQIEALFAGEVDIGYIGPVPAINGYIQSRGDLRIIAGASNGGSMLVMGADTAIRTAGQLDGKTVAVPQFGNTQHLGLLSLLSANGLAPRANGGTVNIVQSSNADIANLMGQGRIDAAFVPEPWGSILHLRHGANVALDYDEVDVNGIPSTAVVIVHKDFLDSHRDIVEKFIEAHKEATVYINENNVQDIINAQIAEVTHSRIEDDVLASAFTRLEITYEIPADSIMNFARTSLSERFISALPDDDIIDDSFI